MHRTVQLIVTILGLLCIAIGTLLAISVVGTLAGAWDVKSNTVLLSNVAAALMFHQAAYSAYAGRDLSQAYIEDILFWRITGWAGIGGSMILMPLVTLGPWPIALLLVSLWAVLRSYTRKPGGTERGA